MVEVSGTFNESGEFEALRIEKKAEYPAIFLADGRKLEIKGTVASGLQPELEGIISDFDGQGDFKVRVRGNAIKVNDVNTNDFVVQAPKDRVTAVEQNSNRFTLVGVTVDTSLLQDDDFEGLGDLSIGRAAFYQALSDRTAPALEAGGSYDTVTNMLTAREVELGKND